MVPFPVVHQHLPQIQMAISALSLMVTQALPNKPFKRHVEFQVLSHDSGVPARSLDAAISEQPDVTELRKLIEPHLDGQRLYRIEVIVNGEVCDMFVGELHSLSGLPVNARATKILRDTVKITQLDVDPALAHVHGPVVVFDELIFDAKK